jgi:drug/metabolite transporter (DMT)-like permease
VFISASLLILPQETGFGRVTLRDVSVVFLISGPAFSAGALVYYRGIRSIGLARAYPMVNTYPLFSTLFAVLLLGERPHWQVIVGTVIIVTGACLVARSCEESPAGTSASPGTSAYKWMALLVGASLLFAVSTTANKVALMGGLSPMLINLARSLCALLLGTTMAMANGGGLSLGTLPRSSWGRIAASSLVADLVGHYMYFLAMQRGQVSIVVPLAATTPLFVIPLARFVLKESVTWPTVVGTLLTVAGVALVVIS